MRKFVIYSQKASTAPRITDLKAAGRIDILLHSIISALFASNEFRDDVELHLILMGPPNSPRHITIKYHKDNTISKKDLKKLLEIALKRAKEGTVREIHPGVLVDDKPISKIVEELLEETQNIFLLDAYGSHLKNFSKENLINPIFILGDHEGFEKKKKKKKKKNIRRLSLGPITYFTSQSITIINYELDNL